MVKEERVKEKRENKKREKKERGEGKEKRKGKSGEEDKKRFKKEKRKDRKVKMNVWKRFIYTQEWLQLVKNSRERSRIYPKQNAKHSSRKKKT